MCGILADPHTTESEGTCYSMQFVYSGGFVGVCEKDQLDQIRLQMGLSDEKFDYPVEAGASFIGPEVILCCSTKGLGALSQSLHTCIRKHVCRGEWRDKTRPGLLNSWEAFYFTFTGEDLIRYLLQGADIDLCPG